jgi:hypothetical protein
MSYMFSGASVFNMDLSAWNVDSVSNFQDMFQTSTFNQVLCWDLDFTKYVTIEDIFTDDSPSIFEPDAGKCACAANEYYDGSACVSCEPGTISYGKTELCISCMRILCPPSPSPTVSLLPTGTPAPTATPKPSSLPSPTPTMNPTMVHITEITSSYVSSPALKTEVLYAEEIYLNGVELSASSRRLASHAEEPSLAVEELRREVMALVEKQQATIDAQQATNDAQQATNDALQATMDAQQATIDALQAINDAQQATIDVQRVAIQELQAR